MSLSNLYSLSSFLVLLCVWLRSYGHFTSPTPSMSPRGIFNETHPSLNTTHPSSIHQPLINTNALPAKPAPLISSPCLCPPLSHPLVSRRYRNKHHHANNHQTNNHHTNHRLSGIKHSVSTSRYTNQRSHYFDDGLDGHAPALDRLSLGLCLRL